MTTPQVLLVDADAETRTILRIALEYYGYAVTEAADADAALWAARRDVPDVVVCELWANAARGACVLPAVLRHDDRAHRARIVVLTTRSQPADLETARRAGADRVYTKPVDLATLLADVRALVHAGPNTSLAAPGLPWTSARSNGHDRPAQQPGP
ncbi:MAG: response regulator transcription factor [Gemmatimonadaceae bacterium]